jgi:hypothetical protein
MYPRALNALCLIALVAVARCGGGSTPAAPSPPPPPAPTATAVGITGVPESLVPGETAQLTATASLTVGPSQVITNQAAWRSENTDVATVSPAGLLTGVGTGSAEIRASYQGVTGATSVVIRAAAPPAPERLSICGTVTDTAGARLPDASVEVRDGVNARRITEADDTGRYCLRDLAPDSFTLRVRKSGYSDLDRRVTLAGDQTLNFSLTRRPPASFSVCGTVREAPSARPLGGALVEVRSGANAGTDATSDGSGRYCLTNLQASTFSVRASRTTYDAQERNVTLSADSTLDFALLVTRPTIRIANGAVSPAELIIAVGQRVTIINSDTTARWLASDPHPFHGGCPEVGEGNIPPGGSRQTAVFTRPVRCGYHDHITTDPRLNGTITVR